MAARDRRAGALTLLAIIVALGLGLAPRSAEAAEPGVVADLTWYIPDSEKEQTTAAIQDLGSKWVRLNLQWREAEPKDDVYDEFWFAEYARAITMARAAGQKVIVMVDSAPAWASGSPDRLIPHDPNEYGEFVGHLASVFRGQVAGYEIWNEQNTARFWSGGADPEAYARLLKAAHPAIKAADPATKVVYGGTSGNDYGFLEDVYRAGAKGYFDVLATHPYTYCGSNGPGAVRRTASGRLSADTFTAYRELRRTMRAHEDLKPMWITEFGWNSSNRTCDPGAGFWQGGVSEATQANYLHRAFEIFESNPYVKAALWYSVRNAYWLAESPSDPEALTGLLSVEYEPRPAYQAFKAYAHDLPY